jgi:upstream activation factor subunit UAF30
MATAKKSAAKKGGAKKAGTKSAGKGGAKSASKGGAARGGSAAKAPAKKAAAKGGASKGAAKGASKGAAKGGAKSASKGGAKSASKSGGRAPNPAFMKPMQPSPALAAVVGSEAQPRSQITSRVWDYIKKNGLQDQQNKRQINADERLRPVFGGKGSVSMFEMAKLVNQHLS